jgi:hypothetical protein
MRACLHLVLGLALLPACVFSQTPEPTDVGCLTITTQTNVKWWAGIIQDGFQMPLTDGYMVDVHGNNHENQVQPLLLSNQ